MKFIPQAALVTAALALAAIPAFGDPPATHPGKDHNPGSAHKLAAPGQYCKAESKQHVAGTPGTPFSACVKAQAKLRSGATKSPRAACKAESKKHVKGAKGTPFSLCVSAAAKLLGDKDDQDDAAPVATPTETASATPTETATATPTETATATPTEPATATP